LFGRPSPITQFCGLCRVAKMTIGCVWIFAALTCATPLAGLRSVQEESVNGRPQASGFQQKQQKIQLAFVRHGHGCHNALKSQSKFQFPGWRKHKEYVDPPLTDCGRKYSSLNGAALRVKLNGIWGGEADFVGASSMLHAIETGLDMFPDATIFPLPFVSEVGASEVSGIADQRQWINTSRVRWDYVDGDSERLKGTTFSKRVDQARVSPSYPDFEAFLEQCLVPDLRRQRRAAPGNLAGAEAEPFRLVVVTHAVFINGLLREAFGCPGLHTEPNEAFLVEYNVGWPGTGAALSEILPASCLPLLGGELKTWQEAYLCPRDYRTCVERDPARMGCTSTSDAESPWIRPPEAGASACCVP